MDVKCFRCGYNAEITEGHPTSHGWDMVDIDDTKVMWKCPICVTYLKEHPPEARGVDTAGIKISRDPATGKMKQPKCRQCKKVVPDVGANGLCEPCEHDKGVHITQL